jgi:hypothetical protein
MVSIAGPYLSTIFSRSILLPSKPPTTYVNPLRVAALACDRAMRSRYAGDVAHL